MTAPVAVRPGELDIDVVADAAGRTRAASLRQRYPQRVTMPLHCDPADPGAVTVVVQSPSGGAFSDDELRTRVRSRPGTRLHLTTQAATQVFAGDGAGARHRLDITVAAGAILQFYPGTVIPHAGSVFVQTVDVDVECGGIYLGWDAAAAGRIAHGERYRYLSYDSAVVARVDGRAVARDRQVIEPHRMRAGELVGGDYLATFLVLAPGRDTEPLLNRLRNALDTSHTWSGGAGRLPRAAGLFVRVTAQRAPDLQRIRELLFEESRAALTQIGDPT